MNDKQKIVIFILALLCNFTFLATAQTATVIDRSAIPECNPLLGKDSIETKRNMAALQDDYRAKLYDDSYVWWSYIFNNAPCSYRNLYIYGPGILNVLIEKPEYAARKQKLIDTLLMTYEAKFKYFGDDGYPSKAVYAYNLNKYRPEKTAQIIKLYKEYYDSYKDTITEPFYIKEYLRLTIEQHKKAQVSKENLFLLYDELSTTMITYKSKYINDTVAYKNWNNNGMFMDKMMVPYLKCADLDLIYQPKFKADPNNKELVNKMMRLYRQAKCTNSPSFVPLIEKSFELEPNVDAAEQLGDYFTKKKNSAKAQSYYEKAAELSTDNAKKAELYLKLAEGYLSSNPTLARTYAGKVLDITPNSGKAIIIQGLTLYKMKCGSAFDKKMAACAAVDLFTKAKTVDPSCAKEANAQIASHAKFYPTKSEAFFLNLKSGDSYTISCLGVTTTVRTK